MTEKRLELQSMTSIIIESTFFGIIPLRTGCFIVAYVNLIMEPVRTLALVSKAKYPPTEPAVIKDYFTIPLDKLLNNDPDNFIYDGKDTAIAFALLVLLFDVVLMIGLIRKICVFIRAYVIFNSLLLVFTIFVVVTATILYRDTWFPIIMMYFPCFCLQLYFLLAFHNYAAILKFIAREKEDQEYMTKEVELCEPFV